VTPVVSQWPSLLRRVSFKPVDPCHIINNKQPFAQICKWATTYRLHTERGMTVSSKTARQPCTLAARRGTDDFCSPWFQAAMPVPDMSPLRIGPAAAALVAAKHSLQSIRMLPPSRSVLEAEAEAETEPGTSLPALFQEARGGDMTGGGLSEWTGQRVRTLSLVALPTYIGPQTAAIGPPRADFSFCLATSLCLQMLCIPPAGPIVQQGKTPLTDSRYRFLPKAYSEARLIKDDRLWAAYPMCRGGVV
jgi:hypothetical protein